MTGRLAVLILALAMTACAHTNVPARCAYTDFAVAPYDHITETLPSATLSELAGRLTVRPDHIVGGYPSGLDARIELHGPNGLTELVTVADDGTFARKGLRSGAYCYKVSASGFRSMIGTLTIDPALRGSAPLAIELMIAE